MRTKTKVWLIVAASLMLIGCILFAGVMENLNWDFRKLATVKYETSIYKINEAFDSISIHTNTADVIFAISNDGKCSVKCTEQEGTSYSVSVKNGTLAVDFIDERTLADYINNIGINLEAPQITVFLPGTNYNSLSICGDTGDVDVPKAFHFGNMDISLDTGDVTIGSTVSGLMKITTSTGDVTFDNCDAAEISVKTNTGDVTGTLHTAKVFLVETSTGEVKVPRAQTGGKCEIKTDTGDIEIEIP